MTVVYLMEYSETVNKYESTPRINILVQDNDNHYKNILKCQKPICDLICLYRILKKMKVPKIYELRS
jgi:hypothetical protein